MSAQRAISAGDIEAEVDAILADRMAADPAYKHAENAEAQAAREDEIASAVLAGVLAKHGISADDWEAGAVY